MIACSKATPYVHTVKCSRRAFVGEVAARLQPDVSKRVYEVWVIKVGVSQSVCRSRRNNAPRSSQRFMRQYT